MPMIRPREPFFLRRGFAVSVSSSSSSMARAGFFRLPDDFDDGFDLGRSESRGGSFSVLEARGGFSSGSDASGTSIGVAHFGHLTTFPAKVSRALSRAEQLGHVMMMGMSILQLPTE